jgi:hypothetical protein
MRDNKVSLYDAQHPSRQKAIQILEFIADYIGKPTIFDCKKGNTTWYDLEDKITNIIEGE